MKLQPSEAFDSESANLGDGNCALLISVIQDHIHLVRGTSFSLRSTEALLCGSFPSTEHFVTIKIIWTFIFFFLGLFSTSCGELVYTLLKLDIFHICYFFKSDICFVCDFKL